jgi:hypothetical protein
MGDAKKQRLRRGEQPLESGALVVRADLLDPTALMNSARANYEVYGYYGVSVFVEEHGIDWRSIAEIKFARAEWLVMFRAGDVLAVGLSLWDTGQSPHYDVVHGELEQLIARLLGVPHRTIRNPSLERPEESA